MTIVPLTTYFKMYRRRTGLSLDEVAFLQGAMSSSSVARHERARRLPVLQTAMMYEFIFDACVCDLYEGIYADLQRRVCARARGLLASLQRKPRTLVRDHKIEVLRELILRAGCDRSGVSRKTC